MGRDAVVSWMLSLIVVTSAAASFAVPEREGFITDTANILTIEEKERIEGGLETYRNETGIDIAILLVSSLEETDPAQAAVQVGNQWGVGREAGNGIVMLFDRGAHSVHIAVGAALEKKLPNTVVQTIIDTSMLPSMKRGDYAAAMEEGVRELQKNIGEEAPMDLDRVKSFVVFAIAAIIFAAFFLSVVKSVWGKRRG